MRLPPNPASDPPPRWTVGQARLALHANHQHSARERGVHDGLHAMQPNNNVRPEAHASAPHSTSTRKR